MSKRPRKFGEVSKRNGGEPSANETRKQCLRDALTLVYGLHLLDRKEIRGKHISNMTEAEMVALLAAPSRQPDPADIFRDRETGWLRPEIVAEAAELLADPPPKVPTSPDVVVRPGGRWALKPDALALDELEAEAERRAVHADAVAAFS